jgi:hypothetical protein
MREGEAARAGAPSVSRRGKSSAKSNAPFVERRRVPRPKFAEIRRGPVSISCRRAWWRARCVSSSSCSSPCSASPSTVTPRLTCRRPTPVLSPPLSFEGGQKMGELLIRSLGTLCSYRSFHGGNVKRGNEHANINSRGASSHCFRASCRSSDPSGQGRGARRSHSRQERRPWRRPSGPRHCAWHSYRSPRSGTRRGLPIYARHALQILTLVAP